MKEKIETGFDIKIARTRKRLKQLDLARRAEIERSRLSLIENEWKQPTPEEIERIKQVLAAA